VREKREARERGGGERVLFDLYKKETTELFLIYFILFYFIFFLFYFTAPFFYFITNLIIPFYRHICPAATIHPIINLIKHYRTHPPPPLDILETGLPWQHLLTPISRGISPSPLLPSPFSLSLFPVNTPYMAILHPY
jgi:hypothetical protein